MKMQLVPWCKNQSCREVVSTLANALQECNEDDGIAAPEVKFDDVGDMHIYVKFEKGHLE